MSEQAWTRDNITLTAVVNDTTRTVEISTEALTELLLDGGWVRTR